MPLWPERDISHSSTERVVLADSCVLIDYMIDRLNHVLNGLVVREGAMRANIDATGGLVFSQRVLLALTDVWGDREKAYRIVQSHAMEAWEKGGAFRDRLAADPEVRATLTPEGLNALFDPGAFLKSVPAIFERVLATPWGRR